MTSRQDAADPLMPCPMPGCGKPVEATSAEYANVYDDFVLCTEDHCPYSATVEQHAILTRRAEIGRIIEDLMARPGQVMQIVGLTESVPWAVTAKPALKGAPGTAMGASQASLLDALRALAKEVNGDD